VLAVIVHCYGSALADVERDKCLLGRVFYRYPYLRRTFCGLRMERNCVTLRVVRSNCRTLPHSSVPYRSAELFAR